MAHLEGVLDGLAALPYEVHRNLNLIADLDKVRSAPRSRAHRPTDLVVVFVVCIVCAVVVRAMARPSACSPARPPNPVLLRLRPRDLRRRSWSWRR